MYSSAVKLTVVFSCFSAYRPLPVVSWWKSSPSRWRSLWCPPRAHVPVSQVSYTGRPGTDMFLPCAESVSLSEALCGAWVPVLQRRPNSGQNNPFPSCLVPPNFLPYFALLRKVIAYLMYFFLFIKTSQQYIFTDVCGQPSKHITHKMEPKKPIIAELAFPTILDAVSNLFCVFLQYKLDSDWHYSETNKYYMEEGSYVKRY